MKKIAEYIAYASILVFLFFTLVEMRQCSKVPLPKIDTLTRVNIIERPVFVKDTVRVKTVSWKVRDSIIFIEHDSVPCGDTSFVAQSDSVVTSTGDTLNLSFGYHNRKGAFSVVFRPRPDSIVLREVQVPVRSEEPTPYGTYLGMFGLGLLIGVVAGLSK